MDVTRMNGLSSPNEEFIILSENQLIEELSESIKNGNNGNTKNARNYSKEMKEKYVVNCIGGSIDV